MQYNQKQLKSLNSFSKRQPCRAAVLKKLDYLLLIVLFFWTVSCKSQTTFNKQYDYGIDVGIGVIETNDGYIYPYCPYFNSYFEPIVFQKVDFNGDTVFRKIIGVPNNHDFYIIYSIEQLSDSNYILGSYNRDSLYSANIFLAKTTSKGDTIWTRNFHPDSAFSYSGNYLLKTSDGGFLISGQRYDTSGAEGDGFLLKTDSNGVLLWDKTYGGSLFDLLYSSVELSDKGFLSLGWTRSFGFSNHTNRDVFLVRTDSTGNEIWHKTFGSIDNETGLGITSTLDGNYLLSCDKAIGVGGNTDQAWLIKIDSLGNTLWSKIYNPEKKAAIYFARELPDKKLISAGTIVDNMSSIAGGGLFYSDSSGNLLWYRRFPLGSNLSTFKDVKLTTDGGFICTGFVLPGPSGNQDAWLIKLDSLGCDSSGCVSYLDVPEYYDKKSLFTAFPNPATDIIFIKLNDLFNVDTYEIEIFNVSGQCF